MNGSNTKFKKGQKTKGWTGKKNPQLAERNKKNFQGEGNPAWKGGISKQKGYRAYYNRMRKERMKKAFGYFSFEEWILLKDSYNNTCPKCKRSEPEITLTVDHIIPISKGGRNTIDNIQPLCGTCNSTKHNKILEYAYLTSSLVVGAGEVGISLFNVLKEQYQTYLIDVFSHIDEPISYLHICFPWSDDFVKDVFEYQNKYKPAFTIIHSSVPVGTCRKLGAISSPIRGLHPDLELGLKTFPKFIGGTKSSNVADYFRRAGMKIILCNKQEDTEAMKLFDTQYYLECVRFVQRVKKFCNDNNLDFHAVYTIANQTYNEGYLKLNHSEYVRPVLQPIMKEPGGHCLLPNEKLLNEIN